uniref:PDZ domain-containing protein n=1 Tax=Zooxanthella nutricula TaxID=1333877 RepID=A0A7S2L4Z9_9DINO
MAPTLAASVRNTFLHVDTYEASDSDSESDHEAMALAVTHVRSQKRAHTTGTTLVAMDPNPVMELTALTPTPSTSEADGEDEGRLVEVSEETVHNADGDGDCDDACDDDDDDEQPRRVERADTYDAFEATPQHRVSRYPTYDSFEGSPKAQAPLAPERAAPAEAARAEVQEAILPSPSPPEAPPAAVASQPVAQQVPQHLAQQAVPMPVGVTAQAFAPQALMMAMPMGFSPMFVAQQVQAVQQQQQSQQQPQPQQQSPNGHAPVAVASSGLRGSLVQHGGQQQQQQRLAAPVALIAPPTGSKAVACTYLPGGGAHVRWDVDARRFAGHDTTVVSPAFVMDLPGFGPQHFKVVVHSATTRNSRGGTGFRMAKGRGRVELKCDARLPEPARDSREGEQYVIVLDKRDGDKLGVDLASQDGEPWWVKAITGGLFREWNETHPVCQVAPGDSIRSANGVSRSAGEVQEECKKVGTLRLVMQRGRVDAPRFNISFGVGPGGNTAGGEAPGMRGPVCHSFAEQSCCGLKRVEEEFDMQAVVDKASRKVAIHVEVLPTGQA